jgi:hypothetical protein
MERRGEGNRIATYSQNVPAVLSIRSPRPLKIVSCRLLGSSISWSAVHSQLFSIYKPAALGVICMLISKPSRSALVHKLHTQKNALTSTNTRPRILRSRRTLSILQVTPHKPPNPRMHIPHPARRARRIQIPLNEHSTRLLLLRRNNHIAPLHLSSIPRMAYPHDWLRARHVVEIAPARHDD